MKKNPSLFLLLLLSLHVFSQQEYDSLKRMLPLAAHDTLRLAILSDLVEIAPENEWQVYNRQLKRLAAENILKHPDPTLNRFYLGCLSEAYFNEGTDDVGKMNLAHAQLSFRKSIAIDKLLHDFHGLAFSQVELGKILTLQGNYELATEALYQALKAHEIVKDQKGIANTYINIGRIYLRQSQSEQAFSFFSRGYKAYEAAGYTKGMIDALDKMSSVYYEEGKMPQALVYMHRITSLVSGLAPAERRPHLQMFYRVSGKIQQLEGRKDSALYFFKKALDLAIEQGLTYELSGKHRFVASAYRDLQQYEPAIRHASEALKISSASHSLDEESKSARCLYELYELTSKYEKALRMHEFWMLMSDSIRRQEDANAVMRRQFKYEFEKKELLARVASEHRISALKLEAEKRNSRKNLWLVLMAAGCILLTGGALFLFKFLRQKNLIASQKANLLKQKLLLSQMNPHFIFNSLNAIQSFIFRQNSLQALEYLSQLARLMRMILEFSRREEISLAEELTFLKLYLDLQCLRMEQLFTYEIFSNETEPELVQVPPMLAQPFIENAIEHGFSKHNNKGHLLVSIVREGGFLSYTIEDNGRGLKALETHKNKAVGHKSLGMKITAERLEMLYDDRKDLAVIDITDRAEAGEPGSGVRIRFKIPDKFHTDDQSANH